MLFGAKRFCWLFVGFLFQVGGICDHETPDAADTYVEMPHVAAICSGADTETRCSKLDALGCTALFICFYFIIHREKVSLTN